MSATRIMVIRHAEKPDPATGIAGVTEAGRKDDEELSVRGWQRAGALVRYFAPHGGFAGSFPLAVPQVIFATRPRPGSRSLRPLHTVQPLAAELGLPIDQRFAEGEEAALVAAAVAQDGVVLIAWHHHKIELIARGLGVPHTGKWPDTRFDLVWVFDRRAGSWAFRQISQLLLPEDR